MFDVNRIDYGQPNVSINTRTGIPTRIRLLGVIHPDGNDIRLSAVVQMRREFVLKGAVAVRTFAEVVTVDPNLAVAVDAVELDEEQLSLQRNVKHKPIAIPADAAR